MIRNLLIVCVSATVVSKSAVGTDFTLDEFFDQQANEVSGFAQNQLNRIKQVVSSTYIGLDSDKVRDEVNEYVSRQEERLAFDANKYVDKLKISSQRVVDIWNSFLPTEDPSSHIDNPQLSLSLPGLIAYYGYDLETHTITSQGYILNVHRIPRAKNGKNVSKHAVILYHGLADSTLSWTIRGPSKSLSYFLADSGYDVWMPNSRGNKFSKEHTQYKTNSKEFWNFSFHEIAQYDLPAIIDYIKKVKGNDTKIAYIGHSMGTSVIFATLSLRPEYNDQLTVGIAMAPAVFLSNMESQLRSKEAEINDAVRAALALHSYEFPNREDLNRISSICRIKFIQDLLCMKVVFDTIGKNEDQLNSTFQLIMSRIATSGSLKTLVHYVQLVKTGRFQQFDYGNPEYNMMVYGEKAPPEYDLSNVKLNITIFWAQNDLIVNEKDVLILHQSLPETTRVYRVPSSKFNHWDYTIGEGAPRLVYDKVVEILNNAMLRNRYSEHDFE